MTTASLAMLCLAVIALVALACALARQIEAYHAGTSDPQSRDLGLTIAAAALAAGALIWRGLV